MSRYSLTKTRFKEGVWEGLISSEARDAPAPDVVVSLFDTPIRGASVAPVGESGQWLLEVPIPPEAIGDGVMTFLVADAVTEEIMGSFTMIGDDALAEDIRAEMALLRAELDMLKRAFRRHCLETS